MDARPILIAAAVGALAGVLGTLVATGALGPAPGGPGSAALPPHERGERLGADDVAIGSLRVTVETGTANGAGTESPVVVWFENQPHALSDTPTTAFAPGQRTSVTLSGSGIPRTLGALRRASILLTLRLGRASIAASWQCAYVSVEVRREGVEDYETYLERRDVGWLSQDEPPRRSPAFSLQ